MTPLVGNWAGGRRDGVGYYDRWTGRFVLRDRLGAGRPSGALKFGPAPIGPPPGGGVGWGKLRPLQYLCPRGGHGGGQDGRGDEHLIEAIAGLDAGPAGGPAAPPPVGEQ